MDSSTESFVVVHPHHGAPAAPASLAPFFPALDALALPSSSLASTPLDHAVVARIEHARRAQPGGRLFIDLLLELAVPATPLAFPPASPADLAALLVTLAGSHAVSSVLTARSCIYFLALVFSPPHLAARLAHDLLLPPAFRLAVRAFHALDTGNYRLAVKLLADPRVTPDFVPRIFELLATVPEPASDRADLVLSFWRLANIQLAQHSVREARHVVRALCAPERKRGVAEAWALAREWHVEAEREQLARAVLEACFGDNYTQRPVASHLSSLLALPFTPEEDTLTSTFCASPSANLPLTLTVDWRLSKLIAECRPVDALRFYSTVRREKASKLEQSEARDRLLKAVEANLTEVQRTTLELDLSPPPAPAPAVSSAAPATAASKVTQPAWAPIPAPAAPATPAAPPRTITAARLAQQPAPAAPAPTAADLPLSASPFVRSATNKGQGTVLRALETAATPRKPGAGAAGAPASPFTFPPPQQQAQTATVSTSVAGSTVVSTATGGGESVVSDAPVSKAKPTLAGFGSVRQPALSAATPVKAPAAAQTPARKPARREEAADEDEEMGEASAAPTQPGDESGDDFARRAALDPAIARTIAAAKTPRRAPASSSAAAPPSTARRSTRRSAQTHEVSEPSKRRAVHQPAPNDGAVDLERSARRGGNLPPGAFPGQQPQDEDEDTEQDDSAVSQHPEMREASTSRRASTRAASSKPAAVAASTRTPARRSTRAASASLSRASTAEPPSPGGAGASEPQQQPARRSTRASSVQPLEMREVGTRTPVRRSSRLSSVAGEGSAVKGGGAAAAGRSTHKGRGRIDEEEGEGEY
ncbi:hypothetical protein Rhopal_002062-T1 [Rhodotorula paludigena]|uniref:ELYS-like domain-containing protein n=1 Tax=Rhodotorula paludigena TaxID=86838 RepID=A0AAV5GFV9_9BASI|nr:hypothetical protein Rhopal_002062-T1 [Rhodotorula paludigena]